jgi:pimeloyl-ACP methyl ester carboxylesterase
MKTFAAMPLWLILFTILGPTAHAGEPSKPAPEETLEMIPIEGVELTLKIPSQPAPGKPWLWVGEFGGHLKKLESELLTLGWHIAYLPFRNQFGSAAEIDLWEKAYEHLHGERGLASRPALLGISRGGLYVNAWTRRHPDRVSVLYLDNGVCDPRSWPGGLQLNQKGRGSGRDWKRYKEILEFASDAEAVEKAVDPVKGFEAAIRNKVLLISVHGTADRTVPYEDNAKRLVDLWRKSGGRVEVFAKEGGRHHPHGLRDHAPLIDLLVGTSQQPLTESAKGGEAGR